jgi:hypothetical protein
MGIFKFLHSKHIDTLRSGCFRFGRLKYYQLLEIVEKSKWIGDREEGRSTSIVENYTLGTGNDIIDSTANRFIQYSPGAHVNLYNHKFIDQIDAFVLSVSAGDITALSNIMYDKEKYVIPYDACIEIIDINKLAYLIWHHGVDCTSGKKISELFYDCIVDEVIYRNPLYNLQEGDIPINKLPCFIKDPIYSTQSEVRIVLLQHIDERTIKHDNINIKIDIEDGLLGQYHKSEVIVAETSNTNSKYSNFSNEELKNAFINLIKDMKVINDNSPPRPERKFGQTPKDHEKEINEHLKKESEKKFTKYQLEFKNQIIELYWALRTIGFQEEGLDNFLLKRESSGDLFFFLTDIERYKYLSKL